MATALYTPLTCWENVRDAHCAAYAALYREKCDVWFLEHAGPCVYEEGNARARKWEDVRFNRAACDWLWCSASSTHLLMKTAPWDGDASPRADVRNATDGKCRRTPYVYPAFESFW